MIDDKYNVTQAIRTFCVVTAMAIVAEMVKQEESLATWQLLLGLMIAGCIIRFVLATTPHNQKKSTDP